MEEGLLRADWLRELDSTQLAEMYNHVELDLKAYKRALSWYPEVIGDEEKEGWAEDEKETREERDGLVKRIMLELNDFPRIRNLSPIILSPIDSRIKDSDYTKAYLYARRRRKAERTWSRLSKWAAGAKMRGPNVAQRPRYARYDPRADSFWEDYLEQYQDIDPEVDGKLDTSFHVDRKQLSEETKPNEALLIFCDRVAAMYNELAAAEGLQGFEGTRYNLAKDKVFELLSKKPETKLGEKELLIISDQVAEMYYRYEVREFRSHNLYHSAKQRAIKEYKAKQTILIFCDRVAEMYNHVAAAKGLHLLSTNRYDLAKNKVFERLSKKPVNKVGEEELLFFCDQVAEMYYCNGVREITSQNLYHLAKQRVMEEYKANEEWDLLEPRV